MTDKETTGERKEREAREQQERVSGLVQRATAVIQGAAPNRYAGDGKNDPRAITPGYWWASWDHESGRTVTTSWLPDGSIIAAGYTRGGGDSISFHAIVEERAQQLLCNWLTKG